MFLFVFLLLFSVTACAGQGVSYTEAEYFSQNEVDYTFKEMMLLESSLNGITLAAPPKIDIKKRDILPAFLSTLKDSRRQWEVTQPKNFYLLAYEANTGSVYVGSGYSPPEKESSEIYSRMPPEPEEVPPYTKIATIEKLEVRKRLNIPWEVGDYYLTAIYFDWISNTVNVSLVSEGEGSRGSNMSTIFPVPSFSAGNLPSFEALSSTPKIDNKEGVFFVVHKEKISSEHLPVFGAFNVNERSRYIASSQVEHSRLAGVEKSVKAVVPVSMIVFGLDSEIIIHRYDWGVPVYELAGNSDGSLLRGYFALDVSSVGVDNKKPLTPGQYVAYVLVDKVVSSGQLFRVE